MKRALIVLTVLAVFALPASGAGAAGSQEQQIKVLQQQVRTLQKQVKSLQKQVKIATTGVNFAIAAVTCSTAITVDAFQATWTVFNGWLSGMSPFIYLTPVSDYGACAAIGPEPTTVERTPAEQTPSLTAFKALLFWLGG